MQPLNHGVWNSFIDAATRSLKKRPLQWLKGNEVLCKAMKPASPESSASFLMQRIYPVMLPALT